MGIPDVPQMSSLQNSGKAAHSRKSSVNSLRAPASPFDPLSSAVSAAQARYTVANPQSLRAHNEACHNFPGGNTRTVLHASPFPITFVNGSGCELTSQDGDIYIDFLGEYTAGLYGHSNQAISSAVIEALKDGWNLGGPNIYERKLAQKVTHRFGLSGIELVRFTNSGTEANTMALAAAVAFTGRKKVLVFSNGYHGGTLSFPSTISAINTNLPHDFVVAPYNDIENTRNIISSLPDNSLAAIIVEPIQGSGGCIVGQPEFLQYLNATAHKLGALFIVDEVMTSRLSYHGISSTLGLKPDLLTLGKWIGGGMTFGAFGGRKDKDVMSLFDPRNGALSHSGTFNNNVVTMAAGCAGLDVYTEDEIKRLNALGDKLKDGVGSVIFKYSTNIEQSNDDTVSGTSGHGTTTERERQSENSIANNLKLDSLSISDTKEMRISGQGSMLCIHFSGENEKSLKVLFWHHMLENGIYMAPRGFIALNLELREEHVKKFLDAVDDFVGKYRHMVCI